MIIPKQQWPFLLLVFIPTIILAQEDENSILSKLTDIAGDGLDELSRQQNYQYTYLFPRLTIPASDNTVIPYSGLAAMLSLLSGLALGSVNSGTGLSQGLFKRRASANRRKLATERVGLVTGFTDQLYRLAEVFQKFNVDDPGCQLYVSCESTKPSFILKNGKLAKTVSHVMRNVLRPENLNLYKDDIYMSDLVNAFKLGTFGSDCAVYRRQCSRPELPKRFQKNRNSSNNKKFKRQPNFDKNQRS